MNLKKNKGVTLIALLIAVIVMMIIAGITIYSGSGVIREAMKEDVKTNMLLIQAEIKNYVEQAKFEGKDKIEEVSINGVSPVLVSASGAKNGAGETIEDGYYSISNMDELNLGSIENQEQYLIAYNKDKLEVYVYFLPGVTDSNGTVYYELSNMQ